VRKRSSHWSIWILLLCGNAEAMPYFAETQLAALYRITRQTKANKMDVLSFGTLGINAMRITLIWLVALFLMFYPLIAPWKRSFIAGWLVIWFSLWALFFARVDYELTHTIKGVVSGSALISATIFIFAVSSLLRTVGWGILQWWRRKQ